MSSLNAGLPASRAGWRPEVLQAAAQFTCGDVVENPPYFYFADPRHAVMAMTEKYNDSASAGPEIIDASDMAPPFGVITSQTCDLREIDFDPPSKAFISVSPVFDATEVLSRDIQSLLRKGRQIQSWLHLPALSQYRQGVWVADFRLEVPIEKSWLVGRQPISAFASEVDARRVPRAVYEIRSRPAWSDDVVESVQQTLDEALRDVKQDDRILYRSLLTQIAEVGARADSMLEPQWVQVAAFSEGDVDANVAEWWLLTADKIAESLSEKGIEAHEPQLHDLGVCPVAVYREFSPVLLGRHSPR